jgi:hypothetical protein
VKWTRLCEDGKKKKNKIIKMGVKTVTVRDLISIYQGNVYEAVPVQYAACRKK